MSNDEPGFSTLSIHAGARPDPTTGARITPIYQTTAFVFDDVDHAASLFGLQAFGNIYTRITNPTTAALEERVAALEGAPAALAVASGHAAQAVALHALMQPGDEFIASTKLYGGSINQFTHAFKNFGWQVKWADPDDPDAVSAALTDKTRAIFIESIANPGGVVTDLEAIAKSRARPKSRSSSTTLWRRPISSARSITAPTSSFIPRPNIWAATAIRWAGSSSTAARSSGWATSVIPCSPRRGPNITAWCSRRLSAISAMRSPAACSRCAISARRSRRSIRS